LKIKKLSDNFTNKEFSCPHCWDKGIEYNKIKPEFVDELQNFRDFLCDLYEKEIPLVITSACRCPEHNKAIGGAPASKHILGFAVDLYSPKLTLKELYKALEMYGIDKFDGVGIYPQENFLHLDCGFRYARWVKYNKEYIYFA
jgi:uncharacterized protein YcbK (DUF882 family)